MQFDHRTKGVNNPDIVETDKSLKIAVIGGGASGLTAAHSLKKQGYANVTVFERESAPGGKVCSYEYNGHHYELGALYFDSVYYKTILELAKEFNVDYEKWQGPFSTFDMKGRWTRKNLIDMIIKGPVKFRFDINDRENGRDTKWNKIQLIVAFFNWRRLVAKHRRALLEYPGFPSTLAELYENFIEFARRKGIYSLAHPMAIFMTVCGYGYFDEVPAVNYMKLAPVVFTFGGIRRRSCFVNGFQQIWKQVAASLNISYNAEVSQINRYKEGDNEKTEIMVNGKTDIFDRVIISTPLEFTHQFMKCSEKESYLFHKIKNYEYYVTLIKLKKELSKDPNVPHKPLNGGIIDHIYKDTMGHITATIKSVHEENVYTFYQLNNWEKSPDEMFQLLKKDVTALGGEIDDSAPDNGIIIQKRWAYFPHVSAKDLEQGFYQSLMALQGAQGTYYIGGIMDFESVEHTARFAKYLMEKHFR